MSAPALTVVLPAHHRTEFLRSAVASVLGQSLSRSEYELIVVKNFEEEETDRFLRSQGVQLLRSDRDALGGKLAEAIAAARGEVLTFLEDDDLYAPDRLACVRRAFEDPQLGYLHNATQLVDRQGLPLAGSFRSESRRQIDVAPKDRSRRAVRWLLRASAYFNLSSIALRREAIASALPHLAETNLTCDNLLFYSALVAPLALRNEPAPLTYYRLHWSASWESTGSTEFFERERRKWGSIVDGFERIVKMADGSPIAPFAQGELLERQALFALAADPQEAPFPARRLPGLLRRGIAGDAGISVSRTVAGLALRTLAPGLERRWYAEHARRTAQHLGIA
ncbi:MAG: glycosyltransferase [Thermoplasmata archaeon]|nr:glycosyltransferase [Thermoplasmata archaeon]MCI4341534.1 glycosyltransferase [Thermoplasmata archaeon]